MTRPIAERELARGLRADGWTLREIAEHIGIALGTASEWVRDVDVQAAEQEPIRTHRLLVIWDSGSTKRCARCGLVLPVELFSRYRDGRQGWCRRCFTGHHVANGQVASSRRRERYERACAFVADHLAANACVDCGEPDAVVLEFDHVGAKRNWVSRLMARGAPLSQIQEEIERCEVVCVNCHRRRTAQRGGSRRLGRDYVPTGRRPLRDRNYAYLYEALRSGCVECGETDLVVLDFDHRGDKLAKVTDLARNEYSLARLQREIDRCEVRCANCHRRRTATARGGFTARG
jgi:hypothetical protein